MPPQRSVKSLLCAEGRRLRTIQRRNVSVLRAQPWRELSGAFGDIGTFIPIFVAMCRPEFQPAASVSGDGVPSAPAISPAATLLLSGLANVLTGVFFGLPLPVQPMKAIAAVAIADPHAFDAARVSSAGLFVGGVVGVASAVGAVRSMTDIIPLPVVRGIQVAAGLSLATKGLAQTLSPAHDLGAGPTPDALLSYVGTALALALLVGAALRPRLPYVLIVVAASALVGAAWLVRDAAAGLGGLPAFELWRPQILIPGGTAFVDGALALGLGQIPLTALNSIVAVVYLAESLFPARDAYSSNSEDSETMGESDDDGHVGTPSATAVGLSVALMNLVGCWFLAMPVCHGSGGLAAQYAFGARSGASVVLLGVLKMAFGLIGSDFVLRWSAAFPARVLGILLALAGTELIKLGEGINGESALDLRGEEPDSEMRMRRYVVMMATVAASLGLHNAGIGFVLGLGVHLVYKLKDMEQERLDGTAGRIRLEADTPTGH